MQYVFISEDKLNDLLGSGNNAIPLRNALDNRYKYVCLINIGIPERVQPTDVTDKLVPALPF